MSAFLAPLLLSVAVAQETTWFQGTFDAALPTAKDSKAGLLLLYCWQDNSGECETFYQGTVQDKKSVVAMADFVCFGAKKEDAAGGKVHERFKVERTPCVLFLKADGTVEDVLVGGLATAEFVAELERIKSGKDTIGAMQKAAAEKPADLALQLRLAKKLRASGDRDGAAKVVAAILEKDPKGQSEAAAEAMLQSICDATFRPEITPQDVDLKALKEFILKQKNKRILFLAHDRVMAAEWRREDIKAATAACAQAWKIIPPEEVLDWGNRVVARAYEFRKDLDKAQQRLMLDIARKSIAEAEKEAKARADGDLWLADRLYTFAAAQYVNNMRKEAFATMERAITLAPKNEDLKKALDAWKDGAR